MCVFFACDLTSLLKFSWFAEVSLTCFEATVLQPDLKIPFLVISQIILVAEPTQNTCLGTIISERIEGLKSSY